MADRLQGAAAAEALFDALPDATRKEASALLADVGGDVLEIQKRQAPYLSGALRGALSVQQLLANLRVRIGLFNLRKGKGSPWYGSIVYHGRKAQTVTVHRFSKADRQAWNRLIRDGKARRSRKPTSLGISYSYELPAQAANPFLDVSASEQGVIDNRLSNFWSGVMANLGGAA